MSTEPGTPDPPAQPDPMGSAGSEESVRESPGLFSGDVSVDDALGGGALGGDAFGGGAVGGGASGGGGVSIEEPPAIGPRADWRRLLSGGPPRKLLARLVQGDPLGVRRLVGQELRASAVLLDADRVHLRALARCARHAARYEGRPNIEAWLRGQVSRAVREILREEGRALREAPTDDDRDAHSDLARPLGLDPRATRTACDAFNRRPVCERLAFYRLLLEHASLEDVARETNSTVSEVARRARRALDAARGVAGAKSEETP